MKLIAAVPLAALLAAASAAADTAADLCTPTVASSRIIPATEFNARAAIALSEDEPWVKDPVETALAFLRERQGLGCKTTCLMVDKKPGEGCDDVRVTVIRDGFLDDSIRGDWTQIDLLPTGAGGWTIGEVRTAVRCRRGHDLDTYSAEACP